MLITRQCSKHRSSVHTILAESEVQEIGYKYKGGGSNTDFIQKVTLRMQIYLSH